MHDQCVIAEYLDISSARQAVSVLSKAGFGSQQVSCVTRKDHPELENIAELEQGAADNAGSDNSAGIGALMGGAMSAPMAAGSMVGPFILVGPLAAVGLGAAVGSALGSAQRWGVNREAGEDYEKKVENGSVLVIVSGSETELKEARRSLQTTGPESLNSFARSEHTSVD